MKKTFLSFAIVGALFAIDSYADSESMVAVYKCQDECNIVNDKTNFSCVYPDGKNCGSAMADIFVSQTVKTIITPSEQQRADSVSARSATVTARAAKKSGPVNTTKKTGNGSSYAPNGGSSGAQYTALICENPECEIHCATLNGNAACTCVGKTVSTQCGDPILPR